MFYAPFAFSAKYRRSRMAGRIFSRVTQHSLGPNLAGISACNNRLRSNMNGKILDLNEDMIDPFLHIAPVQFIDVSFVSASADRLLEL